MSLTIADRRVDEMQAALAAAVRALDRWKNLEHELAEIRQALEDCAEAIYNGTLYDPEDTRDDGDASAAVAREELFGEMHHATVVRLEHRRVVS